MLLFSFNIKRNGKLNESSEKDPGTEFLSNAVFELGMAVPVIKRRPVSKRRKEMLPS